jgi:RNA polymerase sigma factor (sigma-70 family)
VQPSRPAAEAEASRLQAFLEQHQGLIRRVVRHVGGSRAEPIREDVEQNVLMALWRRLGGEQDLDLTPSYVYKAALRETIRLLEVERARGQRNAGPVAVEVAAAAGSPFEDVWRRECLEAVEAGLAGLSADRQRAARLHLQGFRVEEIMRLCGWSYQTARNLVARAMADLRQAMRERGFDA